MNRLRAAAVAIAILAGIVVATPAPSQAHPTALLDLRLAFNGATRQYTVYVPSRQPIYRAADPRA